MKFCKESETEIFSIDNKVESSLNELNTHELRFRKIIESAQDNLRYAKESLNSCESQVFEDDDDNIIYPDCNYEKQEVASCRYLLEVAESKYDLFKQKVRDLEKAISEYQKSKNRYKNTIHYLQERAIFSLIQLINGASDYISLTSQTSYDFLSQSQKKHNKKLPVSLATDSLPEAIPLHSFPIIKSDGQIITAFNKYGQGMVATYIIDNGVEHICSELMISKKGPDNVGKILSINIPSFLQNQKLGNHLITNMEMICRSYDCHEISYWANSNNIEFYQSLNYKIRNDIKGAGGVVYKQLESGYYSLQKDARIAFEVLNRRELFNINSLGLQKVSCLNIISPEEIYDSTFWSQHGENQERYIDLVEKYHYCIEEIIKGKHLDQIRKENEWIANSYDIFHGSDPIRLLKLGHYFKVDSNGRHRVAAAQLYYLKTGKIINLPAEISELILNYEA